MERYISVAETAERWNVSQRRIQILCNENRIKGAIKQSGVWLIPYGAKKPDRIKSGVKVEKTTKLNVLSLFSGCGGMDLGFEGGFNILKDSLNEMVHPEWQAKKCGKRWVKLPDTRFHTVFANDIKPEAKAASTAENRFSSVTPLLITSRKRCVPASGAKVKPPFF